MTVLDLCSYLGLGATGAVTVNLLLGMLMSLRYSPQRQWPHRHVNVFFLHRWTAYIAVALTLTHPLVLLLVRTPRFGFTDLLWPIHSPLQPKVNLAGAGALYLLSRLDAPNGKVLRLPLRAGATIAHAAEVVPEADVTIEGGALASPLAVTSPAVVVEPSTSRSSPALTPARATTGGSPGYSFTTSTNSRTGAAGAAGAFSSRGAAGRSGGCATTRRGSGPRPGSA